MVRRWLYSSFSFRSSSFTWSSRPMIRSRVPAFSRLVDCMKRGMSNANCSTKELSSCWPALRPEASVTFRSLFLPDRSTTIPLESSRRIRGGRTEPSRWALPGR